MASNRMAAVAAIALIAFSAVGAETEAAQDVLPVVQASEAATPAAVPEAPAYYYTLGADGRPVFTQVVRWDEDPNALEYRIIVRDASGETYLDERTTETKKDFHLPPGSYSYRIITYNLLGKPDGETDWVGIVILKAEQPKLSSASPAAIYMDTLDGRITIVGDKLLPEGTVSLVPTNGKPASVGKIVARKEDKEIVVLFPDQAYQTGDYTLAFMNPGGLTSSLDRALRIRFQRPVDLLVSLGYTPFVSIGDEWFAGAWAGTFKPIEFGAGIDLYFIKQRWGFIGIEAAAQWRRMNGGTESAQITSDFVLMGGEALYKYRFTRQFHGLLRAGGGIAWSNHDFNYQGFAGPTASSYDPFAQAGLAFQAFFRSRLYGEIGADCTYVSFIGHYSLGITTRLLAGYQLF